MATDYPNETISFRDAVSRILAAYEWGGRPMPVGIRDNIPGTGLLVIHYATASDLYAWRDFFGVRGHRCDPPLWAWGWHGWTVNLEVVQSGKDSGSAVVSEAPPADSVTTEALVPCERRIVGDPHDSHTHEHSSGETVLCIGYESRRQAVAAAILTPDAPILSGSAMCRVPHIRTGDGPSIVARCTLRAGHDGDHVDTLNGQWANDYTAAVAL